MSKDTDRYAAVKTAMQDYARDLEADLAKFTRYRGIDISHIVHSRPGSEVHFRDPGPDLESLEKQRAEFPGQVQATVDAYRAAGIFPVHDVADPALRLELMKLRDAIHAINTHADAAALVATFTD